MILMRISRTFGVVRVRGLGVPLLGIAAIPYAVFIGWTVIRSPGWDGAGMLFSVFAFVATSIRIGVKGA